MTRLFPMSLAALLLAGSARGEKVTVAAAADLRFAMEALLSRYKVDHPKDEVEVIYGSSGKFHTQIHQGAPFDLFFSADISLPEELAQAGLAASPVTPYARGRLVLWSAKLDAAAMTLKSLTEARITHVAIASPQHAPYGKRAMEALEAAGLLAQVEPKLVYGESVSQAAQFVQSGSAEVGLIALALAKSPQLSKTGYFLVPESLHQPLIQGFVVLKRAAGSEVAKRFAAFMAGPEAKAILAQYGFGESPAPEAGSLKGGAPATHAPLP